MIPNSKHRIFLFNKLNTVSFRDSYFPLFKYFKGLYSNKTIHCLNLLYRSQFWTLTKERAKKMERVEIKFLKGSAGYILCDDKQKGDVK